MPEWLTILAWLSALAILIHVVGHQQHMTAPRAGLVAAAPPAPAQEAEVAKAGIQALLDERAGKK